MGKEDKWWFANRLLSLFLVFVADYKYYDGGGGGSQSLKKIIFPQLCESYL